MSLGTVRLCLELLRGLASRITRHTILGPFCRDSGSGGVLGIISEGLRGRFASCSREEIEKGRAFPVTLEGGNFHPLAFCCLHVVPERGIDYKRNSLNRVGNRSPKVGDACFVLGGDLNFLLLERGVLMFILVGFPSLTRGSLHTSTAPSLSFVRSRGNVPREGGLTVESSPLSLGLSGSP